MILAFLLLSSAQAMTVDLELTIHVRSKSSSFVLEDVELHDGAMTVKHVTKRVGRHDYDIEVSVWGHEPSHMGMETTIRRSDTNEIVTSPQFFMLIGQEAVTQPHDRGERWRPRVTVASSLVEDERE